MSIIEKAIQSRGGKPPGEMPPSREEGAGAAAPSAPAPGSQAQGRRGQVDFSSLTQRGFPGIDPSEPLTLAELRHLKRSVLQCAFGPLAEAGSNVLAITSPMPGAGKTFLAANLAQSLAMERDRTTLLIDADDTRATLSRCLGVHGQDGFFDALHRQLPTLDSLLYSSNLPGLQFVPAGGQYPDSLELLTSRGTQELVMRRAQENRNRLVLLDCPPLLGTPNGAALAGLAGQVLLVIEAGANTAQVVERSLELLNRNKPIGLVLNKLPRSSLLAAGTGSYYYYYGPGND